MNRVLDIDVAARRARVQPGVVNAALQQQLAPYGMCFSPDPVSQPLSTIGGNIIENAGGPHALKYGVTFNHILAAEVVLADGTVISLPTPSKTAEATKSAGGRDIAINSANLSVVVGSEVTLADLARHLADQGVQCAALPATPDERTMGELVAAATGTERIAVRHTLLGLDVVLPDNKAHARFGGENMKDVAGYDAKRLFTGSHGTFGAITTLIFKLFV